ncbi:uncharacterized protein E0L32_008033 [Thyridium curvatum]|uniref:Apc15p protein-domain-containing protein n=1 Tax=Thyridium curvatum TaxID=1093900 RepID=A0A507AW80_9PEZI|nr:uncharacterized protein E0L32_008033 [Thyridium curvatum]TPX10996.1 hypothetical protein E0L32_008033 [Thyridium curvatum]
MFSMLPDLTPSDSHSLWYTSSRYPLAQPNPELLSADAAAAAAGGPATSSRRQNQALLERTPLARLRYDEAQQARRKLNVANFGAAWLRPPGVAKTLYQMREERREQEEHAEAMRREQLAQQLAEAEAEAGGNTTMEGIAPPPGGMMLGPDGEPMDADEMAMGMGDEERDLDDEIPDADLSGGFGYDGVDSDEEGSDSSSEAADDDDDRSNNAGDAGGAGQRREVRHARANEDRVREMMARGEHGQAAEDASEMYGAEAGDLDDEDAAQMLEEDDLVRLHPRRGLETGAGGLGGLVGDDDDDHMDMEADLDDDIPSAASGGGLSLGGYEHTDTEAELSSSEDGGNAGHQESSWVAATRAPQRGNTARFRGSLTRSDRNSLDISGFLSRDGSSVIGSSPQMRRRG